MSNVEYILKGKYKDSKDVQDSLKELANWFFWDVFSEMNALYTFKSSSDISQDFVDFANYKRNQIRSNYAKFFDSLGHMLNDRCTGLLEFIGAVYDVGSDEYVLVKFFLKELSYNFSKYNLSYNSLEENPVVYTAFEAMKMAKLFEDAISEKSKDARDNDELFSDLATETKTDAFLLDLANMNVDLNFQPDSSDNLSELEDFIFDSEE